MIPTLLHRGFERVGAFADDDAGVERDIGEGLVGVGSGPVDLEPFNGCRVAEADFLPEG